jgi:hypothetical protein
MKGKKKVGVRNIPTKRVSVRGKMYSYKNKMVVYHESLLERDYFCMLEIDEDVIRYLPQPIKVDIYVPDVLVERKDKKQLVEIKPSEKLKNMDNKLAKKIETLKQYCQENNMEFLIITEKDINQNIVQVSMALHQHTQTKVPAEYKEKILEIVKSHEKISFQDLFNNLATYYDAIENAKIKGYILSLIANKELKIINIENGLNSNTLICINQT